MSFKFNPITGQLDMVNPSSGDPGPTGPQGPPGPPGADGTSGGGSEPLSNGMLPNPEILFNDTTGDVILTG